MNLDKALKYLNIATSVAQLSKDPSTKVGALIVGPAFEVRSLGYNGAPRGCHADEDSRMFQRPEKYFWMSHAELNAITNAARVGTPLDKCTIICTHFPCIDCARAIVQAGIVSVVAYTPDDAYLNRWKESIDRTSMLFRETDVDFSFVGGN